MWLVSLCWFHPRLILLLNMGDTPLSWMALAFFIVFAELAWLYGFYNIGIVIFGMIYQSLRAKEAPSIPTLPLELPSVALLYVTYNDFVEASAESCIAQNYPHYTVYILDDSTDGVYQQRINVFAAKYPHKVLVVRRPDRQGFKAGNLNYALTNVAFHEPFFAVADADEMLPSDFLHRLVPVLLGDSRLGFAQANHRCNPKTSNAFAAAMGMGIDVHWRWYQPFRNRYGFVMFLGHGAVLRRQCWEEVGGFPGIVSEDLSYSLHIRERGWKGKFVEEVVCYEDFPESVRAFRVRHMKWTRGTCELLTQEIGTLIHSKRISLVEKLDIIFPTLNLPLSLFYFLFIVDTNLILPAFFGDIQPLTVDLGGWVFVLPTVVFNPQFGVVFSADFFMITMLTLISPVLCFVIELARKPIVLFQTLCRSTVLYAALTPISCLGVIGYLMTGKATFLITGDKGRYPKTEDPTRRPLPFKKLKMNIQKLLFVSHPDHLVVQIFEVLCGGIFGVACLRLGNIAFLGVAMTFVLLPVMHRISWEHPLIQRLVYLPFLFMLVGVLLGGLSIFGMQTAFFGFSFHF